MPILLIEDHTPLASLLQHALHADGYRTHHFTRAGSIEDALAGSGPEAILLDRMLPDGDGLDLCRDLRARGIMAPILMISVLGSARDRIAGLDAGADDYLAKPFEVDELLARLRAVLRRRTAAHDARLQHADVALDLLQRTATRDGQPLALRHKELELLGFFLRHPQRLLTRSAIARHVWDLNFDPGSNVIDVSVSSLRRKLHNPFPHRCRLIHTVIGSGYIFGQRD